MGGIDEDVEASLMGSLDEERDHHPQVTVPSRIAPYQLFGVGALLGDFEVLNLGVHRSTVRCESPSRDEQDEFPDAGTCLVLSRAQVLELIAEFPQYENNWRSMARRQDERRRSAFRGFKRDLA